MSYQQDVINFKANSIETFKNHIQELETNVITAAENEPDKTRVAELYVEYQQKTVMLIANKFKIDNEYLKQLNQNNLDANKNQDPQTFIKIQEVLVNNHVQILNELKEQYEQFCEQSREKLREKLATENPQSNLRVIEKKEPLFKRRILYINLSFIIIMLVLAMIVGLIYYLNFR